MASWNDHFGATDGRLTLGLCDDSTVLALAQLREVAFCGHPVFVLRGIGGCPEQEEYGSLMLRDLLVANCVVSWDELRPNQKWYLQAVYMLPAPQS